MIRNLYNVYPQLAPTGDFVELNPVENIVVEIMTILVSYSGERSTRMWNISFGSNILDYIFETLDETTIEGLRREILSSLQINLPDVEFDYVDVNPTKDPTGTIVSVDIYITFTYDNKKYVAKYSFPNKISLTEGPLYEVKQVEGMV